MLELKRDQRAMLVDKLPDIANIAAGGMVFGQFLAANPLSVVVMLCGAGIWAFLLWCSFALAGGAE